MNLEFIDEHYDWNTLTLLQFLQQGHIPSEWQDFFNRKDVHKDLEEISESLQKRAQTGLIIYPSPNLVFRAFGTPLEQIRVVIVGQDVYFNGNAVGLCFSVPPTTVYSRINPSLKNIYIELEQEGYKPNKNGSLVHWANQGCFMINTALTVEKGSPESHLGIWYNFSEKVIAEVSKETKNVAWLLMGAKALEFAPLVDVNKGHKVFVSSHPSPLSAYKGFRGYPAFIGSNIFKNVNHFLGDRKIKW